MSTGAAGQDTIRPEKVKTETDVFLFAALENSLVIELTRCQKDSRGLCQGLWSPEEWTGDLILKSADDSLVDRHCSVAQIPH